MASIFKYRVIKSSLTDEGGRTINPVTSFSRMVCFPQSGRSLLAVFRSLVAAMLAVTVMVDWGLIDPLTSYQRQPNDGDYVWFWFRPQDWIHAWWILTLVAAVVAAVSFKRVDSEDMVSRVESRVYCFIWTSMTTLIPLSATSLIFYYGKIRYGSHYDQAYEATLVAVFANACLELLWGAWPAQWTDVVLPFVLGCGFILYTLVMARSFQLDLYKELDWNGDPSTAATNSAIFLAVLLTCAIMSTLIARNRPWGPPPAPKYTAVETHPLKGPGLA